MTLRSANFPTPLGQYFGGRPLTPEAQSGRSAAFMSWGPWRRKDRRLRPARASRAGTSNDGSRFGSGAHAAQVDPRTAISSRTRLLRRIACFGQPDLPPSARSRLNDSGPERHGLLRRTCAYQLL